MLYFEEGKKSSTRRVWKIYLFGKLLGRSVITHEGDDHEDLDSIFLTLNAKSRGKGFGWKAFGAVSLLSGLGEINAEAAKKNKSSIKSLLRAGFVEQDNNNTQFSCSFTSPNPKPMSVKRFTESLENSFWIDYVDFMVNKSRRVIRTVLKESINPGKYVIDSLGIYMTVDEQNFAVIGYNPNICDEILKLDQSAELSHTIGLYLGYPECCRQPIENDPDIDVDKYEESYNSSAKKGLLDLSNYYEGNSLISHIPCNPDCEDSKVVARNTLDFLESNGLSSCLQVEELVITRFVKV